MSKLTRMLYLSSLICAKKQPIDAKIYLFTSFIIASQDEEICGSFNIHFKHFLDFF